MIPSPITWFTVPSYRCTASIIRSSTGSRILRASSGSRSARSSIEPLRSAKSTVTCFRSPSSAWRVVRIFSARWAGVWASGDVSRKLTPPARRKPHSRQNFAEAGLSWPQRGQRIEPILLHPDRDAALDENVAGRANIRPRRDPGHDAARLAHAPDLPMTAPASLRGHAALVTGAGRNIGRAIVLALAARGCDVVVNTRSRGADAEAVAAEARKQGVKAIVALGDVGRADDVRAIASAAAALGTG